MKGFNNFNKEELEKYEKAGSDVFNKLKPKMSSVPKFTMRSIFKIIAISACHYLAYRIYDHWSYRKNNYIDLFQAKRTAVRKTRILDFWDKVSGSADKELANKMFIQNFRHQFDSIGEKIRKVNEATQDKDLKQIILSQFSVSKLDLGFLQLHCQESYMVINKKGDLVKKSYETPLKLIGVPFGSKKKQAVKKSGKKTKHSKMIDTKARLDLPLVCKKINYFNNIFKQKDEQRKLLFVCREKMQEQQKIIRERLKGFIQVSQSVQFGFE